MNFGAIIKGIMWENRISESKAAENAGISRQSMHKKLRSKEISLRSAVMAANAVGGKVCIVDGDNILYEIELDDADIEDMDRKGKMAASNFKR